MAMECDLEDLADVCERRAAERRLLQENDTSHQHNRLSEECSGERKCEEQLRNQEYEADAAGGSCTANSVENSQNSNRDRNNGLRTIMEA